MSKLSSKLATATFNFRDVTVSLDGESGRKRDELYARLTELVTVAAKDARLTKSSGEAEELHEQIQVLEDKIREHLITLRFVPAGIDKWNEITGLNPPRDNIAIDQARGYNVADVAKATATWTGSLVDTDSVEEGTDPATWPTEKIEAGEWASLWSKLTGGEFNQIWVTVLQLNEIDSMNRTAFLGRGSTTTLVSDETSDSPATSE